MRKALLFICAATAMTACAQNFKLTVNVAPSNKVQKYYIFQTQGTNYAKATAVVDSIDVVDGKFTYETTLENTSSAYICNGNLMQSTMRMHTFFVPGEECVITVHDDGNYYYSGSKFYAQADAADKATEKQEMELQEFSRNANKRIYEVEESKRDSIVNVLNAEYSKYLKALDDACVSYIKAHNTDEGVSTLITKTADPVASIGLLAENVRNGKLKDYFDFIIEQTRLQAEHEAKMAAARDKVKPGAEAPAFTLTDIEGKDFSLASLRGKYVVLDFWGSWCGWCIKGMPKMKEYYAKYSGKLEIVGIDCNDTEKKWKDAVAKYELPWIHVKHPDGGNVTTDYAVDGYPTKAIIDPEGKIVRIISGEDPEFYTLLDEILK